MIYRQAETADIPTLLKLEQAVVDAERPFNAQIKDGSPKYYDLPALVADDQSCLLVVEDRGHIVATGYVQIRQSKPSLQHSHHGYLGFMFVDQAYRGKGINQQLIGHLVDWSHEQGVEDFYLDVYSQNQAAIKAYEKAGFASSLVEMKLTVPVQADPDS